MGLKSLGRSEHNTVGIQKLIKSGAEWGFLYDRTTPELCVLGPGESTTYRTSRFQWHLNLEVTLKHVHVQNITAACLVGDMNT